MKTLKTLIVVALVGLVGMSGAMAEDAEFKFPQISKVLQTQIDKKMEASLQQKTLIFPNTRYVVQEKVKTDKAS